jgi:Small Multidrug Resistance protein
MIGGAKRSLGSSSRLTPKWSRSGSAIVFEVIGTSALKASETFTRLVPSLVTLIAYTASFVFLALSLRTIPIDCLCHVGRSRHRLDRFGWMVLVPADAGRSGTDWARPDRWRRRPCERLLTIAPALSRSQLSMGFSISTVSRCGRSLGSYASRCSGSCAQSNSGSSRTTAGASSWNTCAAPDSGQRD